MTYNTSFSFDSVAVIESIPAGELRTGRDLFETTLAPASTADPGFVSELYEVRSRPQFLGALAAIHEVARSHGRSPIVHIECHGGRDGVHLSNGDTVTWAHIAPRLTVINKQSRMNLMVVAAMCHGWYMTEVLRPVDRAPAFGIIGATEEVKAGQLLAAMQRLYTVLTGPTHDLRAALDAANDGAPFRDWTYRMEGAETTLCKVFTHYVRSLHTEETQEQRVSRLVAEAARLRTLDVTQTMQLRQQFTAWLSDHEQWFMHYRTRFLLLDLIPGNEHRFPLRFRECGAAAA